MSNTRLAEQLDSEFTERLIGGLTVRLRTCLAPPASEPYPPGAVDYWASYYLQWDTGQDLDEPHYRLLAKYAQDAGVTFADEYVDLPVGRAHFVVVDLLAPELWDALDAREADLEYLASSLLSDGELDRELEESLQGFGANAVLVNSVTIDPSWRGLKLGLLGTGLALWELRRGCTFAALDAVEPGTKGHAARAASHERLAGYWGRLGFTPWRDRVLILDLATLGLKDSLTSLGLENE